MSTPQATTSIQKQIAELDYEFSHGGTMLQTVYVEKRNALHDKLGSAKRLQEIALQANPPEPVRPPAPVALKAELKNFVSKKYLESAIGIVSGVIGENVRQAIDDTAAALSSRISTLETRFGALSMLMRDTPIPGEPDGRMDRVLQQLEAQSKRIGDLESRPQMSYEGVWGLGREYRTGQFVSYAGSLWACLVDGTRDKPGTSDAFQLAAKRGRDGR